MTLTPLLVASPVIQLHVAAALAALVLTPVQLWRRKGTGQHRWVGYGWIGAMAVAALTSFFIHSIKLVSLFSPVHLLSLLTLWTLPRIIRAARAGQVPQHKRRVLILVWAALVGAGLFSLAPGRLMHQVAFGAPDRVVQP